MRKVLDKTSTEKQNTHFIFNNVFSEIHVDYEIMWKSMAEPERPQTTI